MLFVVIILTISSPLILWILFETVSAFATVGLSTDITLLKNRSKLLLLLMYAGRLGPIFRFALARIRVNLHDDSLKKR